MISTEKEEKYVAIGKIVGTFGLKGAIKVSPMTDFPERFEVGNRIFIEDKEYKIVRVAWHNKESKKKYTQVRLWLDGIHRVEEAQPLVGKTIFALAEDKPELEENEYLFQDLIGLPVFDEEGKYLGELKNIIHAPAQDIFCVDDLMIPAVKNFIKKIDLKEKKIIVRLIPGMERS
ncbi:MAG TPA: ribosome maturation factor RimM [Fimbriimonadales bacterium]|nr:ribosome maturation factor RimM [Fimbriimonadales bacterium]